MNTSALFRRYAAATSSLLMLTCVAGCPWSGDPSAPYTTGGSEIAGSVIFPPAFKLDFSRLRIDSAMGNVSLGPDGTFQAKTLNGNGALLILRDTDGKAVMMSVVASGSTTQINAKSTAVALIYLSLYGSTLPPDMQAQVLDSISQNDAANRLASVIESRISTDPTALGNSDPQLLAAVNEALAAFGATLNPSARTRTADDRASQKSNAALVNTPTLLVVDPPGGTRQSGVEVVQNPGGTGIVGINHFRRRCTLFAYKTATEDENGQRTNLEFPQTTGQLSLSTTQSLAAVSISFTGISTLLYDWATGRSPWAPITSSPLELPADPQAVKTYYDAIVIGPALPAAARSGPFNLTKYAFDVPTWERTQLSLSLQTCLIDIVIPILFRMWDVHGLVGQQALLDDAVNDVRALMTTSLPEFLDLTRDLQYAAAVRLLFSRVGRDPQFAMELFSKAARFTTQAELLLANRQAMVQQMMHRLQDASILFVVNSALAAGDLAAVINDNSVSAGAETWSVTAIVPRARISPPTANIQTDGTATFTASLNAAEGRTLVYNWTTSSSFGRLGDGGSNVGSNIETDRATVVYGVNGTPPDGSIDTVSVTISQVVDGARVPLATASAQVTVHQAPSCDELNLASYQSGCGSFSLSSPTVTAGETLTVSVYAGCGGGRLACDYADPADVYVDGVLTPGNAGYPSLYSYDPPRPVPRRNGASVSLSNGNHTVQFRIRLTSPNDCLDVPTGGTSATGPWVILGGSSPNRWSSVGYFRVRQSGV